MINKILVKIKPYLLFILETEFLMLCLNASNEELLNRLLYYPIVAIITFLPLGWVGSYVLNGIIMFIFRFINEYLIILRGRPLHFIDFYCIKEALRVSSSYKLVISFQIVKYFIFVTAIVFVSIYLLKRNKDEYNSYRKFKNRMMKSIVGIVTFLMFAIIDVIFLPKDGRNQQFNEINYLNAMGMFGALYTEYLGSQPPMPLDYEKGLSESILDNYSQVDLEITGDIPDNIYVIMNESFADFSLIGDLNYEEDPLSGVHSIKDNCVYGKCAVSVFGGNTCNSEYEFLTGNSMFFLPQNNIPYMMYDFKSVQSLVSEMDSLSYSSIAIHPFYANEWNRVRIYPQLGFSQCVFGEQFSNSYNKLNENIFEAIQERGKYQFGSDLEYYRDFVSDAECYRKAIQMQGDDRQFIFVVTIQGHGAYGLEHSDNDELTLYTTSDAVNDYLNSVKESDDAILDFINYLRKSDKKSVVLFFGDHQPKLNDENLIYKYKYSVDNNAACEIADIYTVPYFFWANYEIDWDVPDYVSLNYLSAVLKKNVGLPLTQFDMFRLDVMNEYPVITSNYVVDKDGNYYMPSEKADEDILVEYAIVQYDRMVH